MLKPPESRPKRETMGTGRAKNPTLKIVSAFKTEFMSFKIFRKLVQKKYKRE